MSLVQRLADTLVLGSLLEELRASVGPYELLDHWQQGEFHHDADARSELKAEHRTRQHGGGWEQKPSACGPQKCPSE